MISYKKDILCEAIESRTVISFKYEGRTRIVEPFLVGLQKNTENLTLVGWWIGGYSKSRHRPQWRHYTVRKMSMIEYTDEKFAAIPDGYKGNDKTMSKIFCKV